jgi:hypothetical protein
MEGTNVSTLEELIAEEGDLKIIPRILAELDPRLV